MNTALKLIDCKAIRQTEEQKEAIEEFLSSQAHKLLIFIQI